MFMYEGGSLNGKVVLPLTSVKVSAQTRERIFRIAVVPFSSSPTLHWSIQQSALEQDYGKKNNNNNNEENVVVKT